MNLPVNNPLGNTFTVNEGEIIENGNRSPETNDKNINNGTIVNNGQINNFNFIDNFGDLNNNGLFEHRDDDLNNFGTITNNGTLRLPFFEDDGVLNNSNSFINNSIVISGSFNNTGNVQNINRFDGVDVTNSGTFITEVGGSHSGDFINTSDGILTNDGEFRSDLQNNGTVINNSVFWAFGSENSGTFTNNGTFELRSFFRNNGTFINNGTFVSDSSQTFLATGSFTGNPLVIDRGNIIPQGLLLDTDFVQNSGSFAVIASDRVGAIPGISIFENNQSLISVTGDFSLNGGDIRFIDISNLDLGTYTLVDLTDGTLTIDAAVLANADDSIDRLDTEEKDFELVQQGNDLLLTIEECFLTGTRILTETGYRKVEDLAIGDLVQTADGELEPVKWIGYQSRQPNQIKNPLRGYPILFKAGSLGHNLPLRDLYTSPDHALLVDGLLINAGALVNDISIIKTEPTEPFCYWHVELEHHALLIAEGTAAESFYPNREDRLAYDNGLEYDELYPFGNSQLMLYPLDYPRISSRNKVPRYICHKLQQIAQKRNRIKDLATA
ncbi:MAG: Hint domain-containing protein [Cyanobacteria bacterium J06643_13]